MRMGHKTHTLEHLKRAIDGREVDARGLPLHAHEDLLGSCVRQLIDRGEDECALRCHPIALGVQTPLPVHGGHVHGGQSVRRKRALRWLVSDSPAAAISKVHMSSSFTRP